MLASAVVLGWLGVGLSASCRFRTLRQWVKPLGGETICSFGTLKS